MLEWVDRVLNDPTAVVTAALVFVTFLLWLATRRLVKSAERTAKRQLRAYISMTPKNIGNFGSDRIITIDFLAKNHGQTPAFQINHIFDISVFNNPLPDGFKFPRPTRPISDESALFPQAEMTSWFNNDRLITDDDVENIEKNTHRLWIWRETFYVDVFGGKWSTQFYASAGGVEFMASVRATRRGKVVTGGWRWQYGPQHNNAT